MTSSWIGCDGVDTDSDAIKDTATGLHCLRIRDGDLWVSDTVNGSLGLRYNVPGGDESPVFIRLPREESINIMKNGHSLCRAMRTCALTQCQTLPRGQKNCVFTEDGNKYCCIGAQPWRAERGVQSGLYRLKHGLPSEEWDLLRKVLKRAESAFDRHMNTNVIRHISSARFCVNFKTMGPSPSSSNKSIILHRPIRLDDGSPYQRRNVPQVVLGRSEGHECSICHKNPNLRDTDLGTLKTTLPCAHVFCFNCLESHENARLAWNLHINCPNCRDVGTDIIRH